MAKQRILLDFMVKVITRGKHNQGLLRTSQDRATNGEWMSAVEFFTMALRYMRKEVMTFIKQRVEDIKHSDVVFVITVPAILSDASRDLIKKAAISVSHFSCIFAVFK